MVTGCLLILALQQQQTFLNSNVITGWNTYTTPPLSKLPGRRTGKGFKRGTTYTYICCQHPFMRGSFRVRPAGS